MNTSIRIFLFSLGAGLIGFGPAGADAQTSALMRCGLAGSILRPAPGGPSAHAAMMRTLKCLQGTGQAPAAGPQGAGGQFVTFDPPGSTLTSPQAIAPDGTIAGQYCDTAACAAQFGFVGTHGFLRNPNGNFTTFDPPGSTYTYVGSISTNGEIAGVYCSTAACAPYHGFIRARDGTYTTFDSPAGSGGINPGFFGPSPPGINPAGAVAGTYYAYVPNFTTHGFLRDKNGAFTTIDAPGAAGGTVVMDINPSGVITAVDVGGQGTGFIRYPNGSFTTIDTPGSLACGGGSGPLGGINPAGAVAGATSDASCSSLVGYLRTPDGTVTTFGPSGPGAFVQPQGINPAGAITGYAFPATGPGGGFLRTVDGAFILFNPPGSLLSAGLAINPAGAITGVYYDANGFQHGFLRLP